LEKIVKEFYEIDIYSEEDIEVIFSLEMQTIKMMLNNEYTKILI
jgi:hypothetical protein